MKKYFDNKSIFNLIKKWKKELSLVVIASIILSVIFSSAIFITPKFKSNAIIYPINLSTYSEESETEQMLQVIQSQEIRDNIFKTFNLGKHYELDEKDPYFYTYLNKELSENLTFRETKYESVEIELLDKDPQIASDIIDSIIYFYNKKVLFLHQKKSWEMVRITNRDINILKRDIKKFMDSIKNIRKNYGLLDFNIQAKQVSKNYAKGNISNELINLKNNLAENGELLKGISTSLESKRENLDSVRREYDIHFSDANKVIDYSQIISSPFPADKKTYPIRWLIVVLSVISSLFVSIIAIGFIENKK